MGIIIENCDRSLKVMEDLTLTCMLSAAFNTLRGGYVDVM